jgi:hypothetical protein
MTIRYAFKLEDVEKLQASMTLTMKLEHWAELAKPLPVCWPARELGNKIAAMIALARKSFNERVEESTSCNFELIETGKAYASLTMEMPIEDWRRLSKQLPETWPGSDLGQKITTMVMKACTIFSGRIEDPKEEG